MQKTDHSDHISELRRNFKLLLLQNPNHFGNLSKLDLADLPAPVTKIVQDTAYEELTCLGYNPETTILTALIEVKLETGYGGGPCTAGSHEFVRFYLDYGDGVWVDHGTAGFNSHDLGWREDLCYAVSVKIDPKKVSCCDAAPVLPRVRAILSWNIMPPANMPNWLPVWGNRLERSIQIEPRSAYLCHFLDKFDVGVQKIDPALLAQIKAILADAPPLPKPVANLWSLAKPKDGKKAADQADEKTLALRHVFPVIGKIAAESTDLAAFGIVKSLKSLGIDLSQFSDFLNKPKFDTSYEDLRCVGLDRDKNMLHGVVQIKRGAGYSGGLCTQGSKEYIAFYLDFGLGWEYQGTTSVEVHDIPGLPRDGLWYQASLPVNLDAHRRAWCETGRARIRGVLSWAVPPVPNQPEFIPHWGDRQDCWIEVRPLPKGVEPGKTVTFLEAIGNMPVDQINSAGFALGPSIGAAFGALDSPFGGAILISGLIAFGPGSNLEYRVMIKAPSDASFQPWTKSFGVTLTTVFGGSVSSAPVTQTAPLGWFDYLPTPGPVFRSVAGNLLSVFSAAENGLHNVYLEVREKGTTLLLASSQIEQFFVDNIAPSVAVNITSGGGNCSKFKVGEVLVGTYAMTDAHSRNLVLYVTPSGPAGGALVAITSASPVALFGPPSNALSYPASLGTAGASGNWNLDTTGMKPCGYNIRIDGWDRTIVNSSGMGWGASDIVGFCLE